MSRQPDLKALALQLGEQAIAPQDQFYAGVPARHTNRRVIYERRRQHLFGRWTEERITIEIDERHWLDRHENTNDSRYGDTPGWRS